jgi:hypothetical protein
VTVALRAAAFVLPLDGIDPRHVAGAMREGIALHEDDGFVWSVDGMSALLALRERVEVIVTLDAADASLADTLLDWGVGVTDQPLASLSEVATIIGCPPLMLSEAAALGALEAS